MKILFICSGNTCRSPVAEAIFTKMIEEDPYLSERLFVDSAGINALAGSPATNEARLVMEERGLSLEAHKSKPVSKEIAEKSDLILVMEKRTETWLFRRYRDARGKTFLLSEFVGERGDVMDPYGKGIEAYRSTAKQIENYLNKLVNKLKEKFIELTKMKSKPTRTTIVFKGGLEFQRRSWDMKGSIHGIQCPFCGGRLVRRGRALQVICKSCRRPFSIQVHSFTLINDEHISLQNP